jgi:hypothetical protein
MAGMPAPKLSCSKCGAELPIKTRVMQKATKCRLCGTLYKPPTYWESLVAEQKVYVIFILIGVAGLAVFLGFLLLVWVLGRL